MRSPISLLLSTLVVAVAMPVPVRAETIAEAATRLEIELGGRVGVILHELGASSSAAQYRADERFPLTSTFKVLLCGAVLARVDEGRERLDRLIPYSTGDLVAYSPVTERHVGQGMTVGDLCAATIALSDNTAGNLLLRTVGGPEGLTNFLRAIGDDVTRLDRWETELNEGLPGDPRDTTTPRTIVNVLGTLLSRNVLTARSRTQLEAWMAADQVADDLIRANLPAEWAIGDKTGAGGHGSRSIVAIIRPPHRQPWLAAIYLTGNDADIRARNQAIAQIGAAIIRTMK